MEFQTQMCYREKLISERNLLENKLREKHEYMASIQHKQANDFQALLCKNDTLSRDYNTLQKELENYKKENYCLCDENNELDEKLNEHCKTIENLKCIRSVHLGTAERLKNEHCDEVKSVQKIQNDLQVMEMEQRAIDRMRINVQNQLTEKIIENTELEKTINTEDNKSEQLVQLINESQMKNEKLNKLFHAKDIEQKNQLNDKSVKLDEVQQKILDKKAEIDFHKKRIMEWNSKIELLENHRVNKKCKFDKEIDELKAEIKVMMSKILTRCAKLNDLDNVITDFKGHLNDQDVVIRSMESSIERAMEKARKISETTESLKNKIKMIREQGEKEKENSVMEMAVKIQEKCKLELMIKNQMKQLTILQNQILDKLTGKSNADQYICEDDS